MNLKNIGGTIKVIAGIVAVVGIILSIYYGATIVSDYSTVLRVTMIGMSVMIFGSLLSLLAGVLIYGYGEFIETTREIADIAYHIERKLDEQFKKSDDAKEQK